jgi:hypothetical protein
LILLPSICHVTEQEARRIVIASVHSPSSNVFACFTHLSVLSWSGELTYAGTCSTVRPRRCIAVHPGIAADAPGSRVIYMVDGWKGAHYVIVA